MIDKQEFQQQLCEKGIKTCPAMGHQSATICVPVKVTPFARPGVTTTHCCGKPIITPGANTCRGTINGNCTFTISQNICVEVPVEFGATATVGAAVVDCGEATGKDICRCCKEATSDSIMQNFV